MNASLTAQSRALSVSVTSSLGLVLGCSSSWLFVLVELSELSDWETMMRFYGFDDKQAKKLKLMCDNHQPCVLKNCKHIQLQTYSVVSCKVFPPFPPLYIAWFENVVIYAYFVFTILLRLRA